MAENLLQRRDYAHEESLERGEIADVPLSLYAWEAVTYIPYWVYRVFEIDRDYQNTRGERFQRLKQNTRVDTLQINIL